MWLVTVGMKVWMHWAPWVNEQSVSKQIWSQCQMLEVVWVLQWWHHQERDRYSTVLWPNEDKWRQLFFFFLTWWCLNLPFLILHCDIKSSTFYSIFTMLNDTDFTLKHLSKTAWNIVERETLFPLSLCCIRPSPELQVKLNEHVMEPG